MINTSIAIRKLQDPLRIQVAFDTLSSMGLSASKDTANLAAVSASMNNQSIRDILCSEPWTWDSDNWNEIIFYPDGKGEVIPSLRPICLLFSVCTTNKGLR